MTGISKRSQNMLNNMNNLDYLFMAANDYVFQHTQRGKNRFILVHDAGDFVRVYKWASRHKLVPSHMDTLRRERSSWIPAFRVHKSLFEEEGNEGLEVDWAFDLFVEELRVTADDWFDKFYSE